MEISYENPLIPHPLKALRKDLQKKHSPLRGVIEKLIDDYVESNGPGFLKMSDLFLKIMEHDINLYEFTESDFEELNSEIEKLDSKFRHVNDFIRELSIGERKRLWMDKYEDNLRSIKRTRDAVLRQLQIKEIWEPVDSLFYSYCLLLMSTLEDSIETLRDLPPEDFTKSARYHDFFSAIYGSIILGYLRGKLREEVLRERLAELATFTLPRYVKIDRKIQNLLEKTSSVMPCPK